MIIIVDHVTSQNKVEGSKKAFVNGIKCVEGDNRFVFFESGLRSSDNLVALSGHLTRIWRKWVRRLCE